MSHHRAALGADPWVDAGYETTIIASGDATTATDPDIRESSPRPPT